MKQFPEEKVGYDIEYHNELFDGINEYASIYHDGCIIHSEKSGRRYLVLFNPELIKKVLQTNNRKYVKGLGIDKVKMLLGNGIMVSEGDYWRKQRRMIQPGFGKEEFRKLAKTVLDRNKKMETLWHAKAMSGEPLNISEEMSALALNIILEVIFSDSIDIDGNASPFHMLSSMPERDLKFAWKFRSLHQVISGIINDRTTKNYWPNDLLTLFCSAKSKADDLGMTTKEIVDEVMTMIVAGHETTASSLTWAWFLLMNHPNVYERLREEAASNQGTGLPNSYISAVVKETLRLYPPGWLISRKACENDVLGDYPILEGTDILISMYAIQRSGSNWEQPDKFFPERFLNDTTGEDSYLPFSTGPRKCIGDQLALMEMQIHLDTMSRLFTIARVAPEQQIPVEAQINLRPAMPVYARVEATCTTLHSKQTNP